MMDEQNIILYGYSSEREKLEQAIAENETITFLGIHGVGGIGKTTILRALYESYRKNETYQVMDLLDFDDLRFHIVQNVLEEIARHLLTADAPFTSFFKATKQLRDMQQHGVSRLRIEDQEISTREAFVTDFDFLAEKQQIILFLDTVEKVQDLVQWQELLAILLQLKNTICLLAGRRNDEVINDIRRQLGKSGVAKVVHLQGLSDTESVTYFTRTQRGKYLLTENQQQCLWVCQLCSGRPILLDLAVDWLSREAGLKIPDRPLNELDEEKQKSLIQAFERNLVQPITQLAEPENEAILDIAHVHHYFDAARHSYLHNDFSESASEELLNSLRTFSFVKSQPGGGIRLHDEMQRMVEKYLWPILDANKTRRRQISESMVGFYDRHLESEGNEIVKQTLSTERLYHQLYANVQNGHQAFGPIFREALARHQLGFAQLLLMTLSQFTSEFDPILEAWADVHKGRLLRAEEKVQEALELIRPAKEKLLSFNVYTEMDTVCNVLGYCYRLIGNWEQAIGAYEEALTYSKEEQDARQIAETMNNIANVSRLSGDFERANRYSLVGLQIREKLNDKRGIAYSCYVRGMITWETGNSAEAAQYLLRARQIFKEIDLLEGIAEIDKYQSYLHFRTGDIQAALPLIRQGKKIFKDKGIGLGLSDSLNLEARILISRHAANVESDEGFREVEMLANEALKVAKRIRDNYKIAESNLTLCRLYYRWGRYFQQIEANGEKAKAFYRRARQKYDDHEGGWLARQHNYLAPASVYEWVMGDIAFEEKDWKVAFDHYVDECEISCRFKDARFARALNGLSDRLHRLTSAPEGGRHLTRQYCEYVITVWKERNLDTSFPEVIEECEYIKLSLRLFDPAYLADLRQWGEDLLTRGDWQKAITVFQKLLDVEQTYHPDEMVAAVMNDMAWAYRNMGRFVEARRLCQQGLLIRQQLGDPLPIASSRLVMGTIMWTTGNTNEAARYLRLAQEIYQAAEDQVGLALANRHSAFMHHLIGDREQAEKYAAQAERIFRERELRAELADILNLQAMMLRQEKRFQEAREKVNECRRLAEQSGAKYALAEAWLTMVLIEYAEGIQLLEGEGDMTKAKQFFDTAKSYHEAGYVLANQNNYLLLISVYEATSGYIAFAEERYAVAFEHFVRDLDSGVRYDQGRMRRELDQVVKRFVKLPQNLRRYYADYIITEWQERGLAENVLDVPRLFHLLKEYNEYV